MRGGGGGWTHRIHTKRRQKSESKRDQPEDERKGEGARKMRARAEDSEGASAGDDAADRPWRRARRSGRFRSRVKLNLTRDFNTYAGQCCLRRQKARS